MILKVTRDRECSEWLSFETNIGGSESRYISTSKEFSLNNNNSNIRTCTSLNEDKTCNTIGSGYEENLDVKQYISVMKGEWANNDFSGFAIPTLKSVEKAGWADRSIVAGSTSIFTANEKYAERQICKSYPEQDAPFNFSDKYEVKLQKCSTGDNNTPGTECGNCESESESHSLIEVNRDNSLWESGKYWCVKDKNGKTTSVYTNGNKVLAFTYDQYIEFVPRNYFSTVASGITLPYEKSIAGRQSLIWVDDNQECYYLRTSYTDYNDQTKQYYGNNNIGNIPFNVCYNKTNKKPNFVEGGANECTDYIEKKSTDFNNINDDTRQGYCIEYSYSQELYYNGSGKYNCITWIPGYVK